ncbi:protein of unknown function [Streptomyces sp. KY75]|nr:protein of unknown function [Streptomyces sp. KY75]CAD5986403.1 protein of unknown function [Streptomyces sp. KY70]
MVPLPEVVSGKSAFFPPPLGPTYSTGRTERVQWFFRVDPRDGTLLMAIGAVLVMIAGPAWLAIVLIVAACCGLAGAFASQAWTRGITCGFSRLKEKARGYLKDGPFQDWPFASLLSSFPH